MKKPKTFGFFAAAFFLLDQKSHVSIAFLDPNTFPYIFQPKNLHSIQFAYQIYEKAKDLWRPVADKKACPSFVQIPNSPSEALSLNNSRYMPAPLHVACQLHLLERMPTCISRDYHSVHCPKPPSISRTLRNSSPRSPASAPVTCVTTFMPSRLWSDPFRTSFISRSFLESQDQIENVICGEFQAPFWQLDLGVTLVSSKVDTAWGFSSFHLPSK